MLALDRSRVQAAANRPRVGGPSLTVGHNLGLVAELHDTTEEYLETILSLEEEGVVPMRARLVERLGLSAAAVSRDRRPPRRPGLRRARRRPPPAPHRQGPRASPPRRAPPPARRAPARRRDRARVGEGARGGGALGARDLGRRRGEARRCCSAIRPRARTATRSRARNGARSTTRTVALADAASRARSPSRA